jgi:hypothetical protein
MPREKEPGVDIEEQKARLRVEELEAETAACVDCDEARRNTGDPTAYCRPHMKKAYGL